MCIIYQKSYDFQFTLWYENIDGGVENITWVIIFKESGLIFQIPINFSYIIDAKFVINDLPKHVDYGNAHQN